MIFISILSITEAREIDRTHFKDYSTALVIYDVASNTHNNLNPARSSLRLPPCSTFKIYNTLIGLELGLLNGPDDPWYQWDGVKRDIDGWNHDLTLREAIKVSAVPAYQILARQIGADRMKAYIDQLEYGSKDISSGIDVFWLPRPNSTPIAISADEQVALLTKLLDGKLAFASKNVDILKDIIRQESTPKGVLYGKTGSGFKPDGSGFLGWFVGFLEHGGKTYIFACNITGGYNPSGRIARSMVEEYFKSNGML